MSSKQKQYNRIITTPDCHVKWVMVNDRSEAFIVELRKPPSKICHVNAIRYIKDTLYLFEPYGDHRIKESYKLSLIQAFTDRFGTKAHCVTNKTGGIAKQGNQDKNCFQLCKLWLAATIV